MSSLNRIEGKKILITAGPTYEKIDPIRFIGNFSSGKMGFELANICLLKGGEVTLVTGPTNLKEDKNIKRIDILTAQEMFDVISPIYKDYDIIIMSAAVSDYRPKYCSTEKIKKTEDSFNIELVKNIDILKYMGNNKTKQFLVGFALETNNEEENAKKKLQEKNLNMIVLNSLNEKGTGFNVDTNKIIIFNENGSMYKSELKSKKEIALDIINHINDNIN